LNLGERAVHNEKKGKGAPMLPWSADTILLAALVVFVAMIAIFVLHILLGVQHLVRLGERRGDYASKGEQTHLTSTYGEPWELSNNMEGERLEQHGQEESEEPKSLPIAGRHQERGQNLEHQHLADKLEEMISQVKQDYAKLEENLKQVREYQLEADQERERITGDLQNIRQILNGRPSSNLTSAAYHKVHRLLSLPNSHEER
jgi:hypothetical protein